MAEGTQLIRGLEGVVAAETQLCDLDGAHGRLAYRGYDIDDLARNASFEEVAHLLWMGELPNKSQLDRFTAELAAARPIPAELVKAFALMPKGTDPNRALQAAVAILGMHDPDATDNSHAANLRKAVRLTSQFATAICAHHRVRSGQEPVPPAKDLSLAANFLYMLTGTKPSEVTTKAFDASLVLYAEHELNASTFTTRVIAATLVRHALGRRGRRGRSQGHAPRRRRRGRHEHAARDRDARQRGRLRGQGARREAPVHGHGPPRLHRAGIRARRS